MSNHYSEPIDRANPGLILLLVDQSASMSEPFRKGSRSKAEVIAEDINHFILNLMIGCEREAGIRDYLYFCFVGYHDALTLGFHAPLGQKLVPVSEVGNNPLRVERTLRNVDDGAGGQSECEFHCPVWIDPVARGNKSMLQGLEAARDCAADFVSRFPQSFPPLVFHFTDWPPRDATEAELAQIQSAASSLRSIQNRNGSSALLIHSQVSSSAARPVAFPSRESELPEDSSRLLFDLSSPLPDPMRWRLMESQEGQKPGPAPRAFLFQGTVTPFSRFLDAGTAVRVQPRTRTNDAEADEPSRQATEEVAMRPPAVHTGTVDLVQFGVTSPPMLRPGTCEVLDVWAYLAHQRAEILERAREESVTGQIRLKSKGSFRIARGVLLQVKLRLDPCIVAPDHDTIEWNGEISNAQFAITVPKDIEFGPIVGQVSISINDVPIAKVLFDVHVSDTSSLTKELPVRGRQYQKVFASYASEDRDQVIGRLQGVYKVRPDLDVFLDVASLRSGDRWQTRLRKEIGQRDALYLFWSLAASRSEWVEREWRQAYRQRGIEFIDPIPLVSPTEVPPPDELAALHFNDWILAFRSRPPLR